MRLTSYWQRKETGVDDEGLSYFHTKTFPYPLFRDESLAFYEALGNRKIGKLELFKLIAGRKWKRVQDKGIPQNLAGEGFKKGGLIVFDKTGTVRAALNEDTGNELDVESILSTLEALRKE